MEGTESLRTRGARAGYADPHSYRRSVGTAARRAARSSSVIDGMRKMTWVTSPPCTSTVIGSGVSFHGSSVYFGWQAGAPDDLPPAFPISPAAGP
jgi:hypothetical protein